MKNLYLIALAAFVIAGCSKEQPTEQVEESAAPNVEETVEPTANETPVDENAQESTLEVVEESAADPEPADEEAIVLAQADTGAEAPESKYKEGRHYVRMVPTQPTFGGADKIEVVEFFWYGCDSCDKFEPYINEWEKSVPANVRVVRAHASWNRAVERHAQLYYTEQALVRTGAIEDPKAFRAAVFNEIHRRGNRLVREDQIRSFFGRFGISEDDFDNAWTSFEVDQQLRVAKGMEDRYDINGVPTIVINGKYRTGAQEAGSYRNLLELMNELIERESLR